ncbi:cytochrome P450 [Bombardia bombarda]|uniref:Cytochrome P450 n=1 Tax=Bombardia bombarda TaxID=252184 RepID=A0AA39XKN8_9PEZI|nr:cytochrome P450 [Bombardia bombarda]
MDLGAISGFGFAAAFAAYTKHLGASNPTSVAAFFVFLTAQAIFYVVFTSLVYRWFISATKHLPHPKNTPFVLGNLVPFLAEPWGFPLVRWQPTIPTTASGFYRIFLGPFDFVIPRTSQAVTTIMSQPYTFVKPKAVRDGLVESLGVGLVSAEGDDHRRQKKLLTPIFGLSRNRRLLPQMWAKAGVLTEKMCELVLESGSKSTILLMHPLTMAATLDVIGVTTLGVDFDSIRRPDQPILKAFQRVFPSNENQNAWARFFGATLPALVSPHLLFKLPLKPIREFHSGVRVIREMCLEQITLKRREIEEAEAAGRGEENSSVEAKEKDILSAIVASGLQDEDEMMSHMLTILAAGHESTAITLAWALFKLAQLPDVQDKLRAEISDTLDRLHIADPSSPSSPIPTLEEINSMPYLRAFLMEVLRMYPAFPSMMREPTHDVKISDDLTLPRGKPLMVSPYAVNRSRELWGDDADEFHVERWEAAYNGGAKTAQAFFTFSSGPRICIGKDFAVLSLKVFLVVLVSKLRFEEAVKGWHPTVQKGTSLKPQGLKIKVSLV